MSDEQDYLPPVVAQGGMTTAPPARRENHIHDFGGGHALVCTVCKRSAKDLAIESGGKNLNDPTDDGFRFSMEPEDEFAKTAARNGRYPQPGEDREAFVVRILQEVIDGKARMSTHFEDAVRAEALRLASAREQMSIMGGANGVHRLTGESMGEYRTRVTAALQPQIDDYQGTIAKARIDLDDAPLERIDVVAHLYRVKRRPGEDAASLATRIRRAAAMPGVARAAVPPWDWSPSPGFKLGDDWREAVAKPKPEAVVIDDTLGVVRADMWDFAVGEEPKRVN